jgi:hypothetical protein
MRDRKPHDHYRRLSEFWSQFLRAAALSRNREVGGPSSRLNRIGLTPEVGGPSSRLNHALTCMVTPEDGGPSSRPNHALRCVVNGCDRRRLEPCAASVLFAR